MQKYLQLYRTLIEKDPTFKFESNTKLIAFILDKCVDMRLEKLAEATYMQLLTRNKNEDFHDCLALLTLKQSYFNV